MKLLGNFFLLGALSGCLPNASTSSPSAPATAGAATATAPCVWRGEAGRMTGHCVVSDAVISNAAIPIDAAGAGVTAVEVLDAHGSPVEPINYAYDPISQSVVFHATEATPRLLVAGAHLTIRYMLVSEQSLAATSDDCAGSTAELDALVSEIASLGASCETDDDCQLIEANTGDACHRPYFAAKSVLTEERRAELGRHIAVVAQACAGAEARQCETEYPRVPSCDPETNECVGRF